MIDLFKVREARRNNEIYAFVNRGNIYIGDTTCVVSIGKVNDYKQFFEWEENKIQELIKESNKMANMDKISAIKD